MKIKAGFVSNSSTCSFVIGGWKTNLPWNELAELFGILHKYGDEDDLWDAIHNHEFIHIYGDEIFLGVEIARGSDSYDDEEILLSELTNRLDKISELAEKLNLDLKTAGVYTGVYPC